jgi:hypothetical protein
MAMVNGPVEFLPATPDNPEGFSLFFANRGQYKLYQLIGIRTFNQFGQYLKSLGDDGIPPEDLDKMVYAGLIWKNRNLTLEDAQDIVEQYYLSGKNFNDLNNVVLKALALGGLINIQIYEISQKMQQMSSEELEAKIIEEMARKREQSDPQGEDMGEPPEESVTST